MNDLTWFGWLYLGLVLVNAVLAVLLIGKEREPRTPLEAVMTLALGAFIVWGIFGVGVQS